MGNKEFTLQRICNYVGREIDPSDDAEVEEILRSRLNIFLPQRRSLNESLESSSSDHEIIGLLLKYRQGE